MLIRDEETTWTAIGQPAHAWLAAQLARAWATPLDEAVILAIEQHDAVWSEWDARPSLNVERRRAASFTEAPIERRQAIWEAAVDRIVALDPYAALLVSMHASNLHCRYTPEGARSSEYLGWRRREQDALLYTLAGVGITRERAERDSNLLTGLDAISLALCHGASSTTTALAGDEQLTLTAIDAADGRYELDPWPFAREQVRVRLLARTFKERYDDEQALHEAMARAPWHELAWQLAAPGAG